MASQLIQMIHSVMAGMSLLVHVIVCHYMPDNFECSPSRIKQSIYVLFTHVQEVGYCD